MKNREAKTKVIKGKMFLIVFQAFLFWRPVPVASSAFYFVVPVFFLLIPALINSLQKAGSISP